MSVRYISNMRLKKNTEENIMIVKERREKGWEVYHTRSVKNYLLFYLYLKIASRLKRLQSKVIVVDWKRTEIKKELVPTPFRCSSMFTPNFTQCKDI